VLYRSVKSSKDAVLADALKGELLFKVQEVSFNNIVLYQNIIILSNNLRHGFRNKPKALGFWAAVIALVIMGCYGPFVREISADETVIALIRFTFGLLFVGCHLLLTNGIHRLKIRVSWPMVFSGIALACGIVFYSKAIRLLPLAQSGFLLYLAPLIVSILGVVFLKEKLSIFKSGCILASFVGSLFLIDLNLTFHGGTGLGKLFGFGSALCYALFIILNRMIPQEVSGQGRTFYQLLFGFCILLPFISFTSVQAQPKEMLFLLGAGFLQGYIALSLTIYSLKLLKGYEYGAVSYLEPVAAALVGYFFYGESLSGLQATGCVIIILAGWVLINRSLSYGR